MLNKIASFLLALSLLVVTAAPVAQADFKVGMVLDKGGKDDKSFNASAHAGATLAKEKLHIGYKYVEATDDNAFESLLRAFAQKDFDLIVGVGFAQREAIKKVAQAFPKKHFVLIDSEVDLPNVRSLMFEEHEGSFIVGAAAALVSKSGKVGFVGGMDVPLIRRFEMGYVAGAKHANPKVVVKANYVGVTGDAWNNPPKAKELALAQYDAGVDVIFQAAGASGAGVFDAAEEKKKFAIGVDSNQNWVKPGLVLTSMLKRIDVALYDTIDEAIKNQGAIKGGTHRFGLASKGVDYAMDQNNAKIFTPELKKKIEELKAQIIAVKIQVPDYYKKK